MTAYVNVHGQPINVSARDAVIALYSDAVAKKAKYATTAEWTVRKSAHVQAPIIGAGASEESAWRDAWSRELAGVVKREGKPA